MSQQDDAVSGAELARSTWPDVAASAPSSLLVVPLGSTEQHGPHLPLSTDTTVAIHLAGRVAARRPDATVAPAVPYGSSGEHRGFAGTLSIGQDALTLLLVELIRSADAFAATLVVSGHGGNAAAVTRALATLTAEGRLVRAWSPSVSAATLGPGEAGPVGAPRADAHAGWVETSVMLALDPSAVRWSQAAPGATAPLSSLAPALRTGGVISVSANGVLGDPTGADASAGGRLLEVWTNEILAAIAGWP